MSKNDEELEAFIHETVKAIYAVAKSEPGWADYEIVIIARDRNGYVGGISNSGAKDLGFELIREWLERAGNGRSWIEPTGGKKLQ